MDTSDPHIVFDNNGFCNHCSHALWRLKQRDPEKDKSKLVSLIERIKSFPSLEGYHCIIGVSGGVDSSFLAYILKREFGLNPLAVHLDNGWNSKEAVKNIKNLVKKLDIDLYTHVIDWEEFKSMQLAYLKASVVDIEVLTDHAIVALFFNTASEKKIPFIVTGINPFTENILPKSWAFNKNDLTNMKDILKKNGNIQIKTLPVLGESRFKILKKEIQIVDLYEFYEFNLSKAKQILINELGWIPYGDKHFESIWTRFYQGYLLPQKFGFDKKKAHLSNQICLGEVTREEALDQLKNSKYTDELISEDKAFVAKKFDISEEELDRMIESPPVSHFKYQTDFKSILLKKVMVPTNLIFKIYKKIIKTHSKGRDF